jgi:hypothetical protein
MLGEGAGGAACVLGEGAAGAGSLVGAIGACCEGEGCGAGKEGDAGAAPWFEAPGGVCFTGDEPS